MYLGGNGFYWRIAFHKELPGVMEVRRGEDGNRPWASEPGETVMSFTGEYAGIWRRLGRPPNALVGVGYTAEGFDIAVPYHRRAESRDPRVGFIFDGVGDEPIGEAGVGFGGAAGQEIDRYDVSLGSPPHALVIARSEGHTDNMMLVNEDLTATHLAVGGVENSLVRADMVFFETGHGGAVFSTGSISWVAALPCNGFDNNVARITSNVLARFVDPAEFPRIGRREGE
jgi:N,N-dimethylformamidase